MKAKSHTKKQIQEIIQKQGHFSSVIEIDFPTFAAVESKEEYDQDQLYELLDDAMFNDDVTPSGFSYSILGMNQDTKDLIVKIIYQEIFFDDEDEDDKDENNDDRHD